MHFPLVILLAAALQVTAPVWNDAPPSMPKGTKIAVLEGNPKEPGLFTIRLKVPKGASIPLHVHPRPERVTVLSGKVTVELMSKKTTFKSGGFYVNPPDEPHALLFHEETVLQLTCEGPWELKYLNE
jgi:quercetin dioxygenase-like cupin family protein